MMKEEIKARLEKKRPTRVFSYIHGEGRLGVLVEIESDTDFALRNELVGTFAHEVCLQITSMNPQGVDDSPDRDQVASFLSGTIEGPHKDKIIQGRLAKWDKENLLLYMPWVKDNSKTIGALLSELCDKMGEKVSILRFARFGK